MKPGDYQDFVFKRCGEDPSIDRYLHAALGASSEAGELAGVVRKAWRDGDEVDPLKVLDESGDVLYYLAMALNRAGYTFADAFAYNVEKLASRRRFGKDKRTERAILERYAK